MMAPPIRRSETCMQRNHITQDGQEPADEGTRLGFVMHMHSRGKAPDDLNG